MKINKMITPFNHAGGTTARIKYIVIHYTGSTGSAQANCKYFMADGRKASAHYFVNHDGAIWQSVEDKDVAWHCTNRNPHCKNSNSLGIELCCRKDPSGRWYFEPATVISAIQLTRELMKKYNVPVENVWRHNDCTGKCCPDPFVRDPAQWELFKKALGAPEGPDAYALGTAPCEVRERQPVQPKMPTKALKAEAPQKVHKPDMQAGWKKNGENWYYMRGDEAVTDEWLHYKHHWYRLGSEGIMLTGWHMIDDNKGIPSACYFDETPENIGMMWHERSDRKGYLEVWTTTD